jgi:hypothetical protein
MNAVGDVFERKTNLKHNIRCPVGTAFLALYKKSRIVRFQWHRLWVCSRPRTLGGISSATDTGWGQEGQRRELEKEKKKKMQRGNAGEVVMKIIIMIFFKTKKLVLLQRVLETRKTQKNFFDCLSLGV